MTNNDKEEPRLITWEQYLQASDWWPSDDVTSPNDKPMLRRFFESLPLAPKHTDEERDFYIRDLEDTLWKEWDYQRYLEARIKELEARVAFWENPIPCKFCGTSLYKDNPSCAVSHREARK
jgi:hypothetical protein